MELMQPIRRLLLNLVIMRLFKTFQSASIKVTTVLQGNFSCGLQCKKRHSCCLFRLFFFCTHRVHLPNYDSSVFGASGEFGAVIWEFAEPHFVAVLCQNLLGVTGELFPVTQEKTKGKNLHCASQQQQICLPFTVDILTYCSHNQIKYTLWRGENYED